MGVMPRIVTGATVRARELRQASTPAEKRLWMALRNRRLGRIKFRRQHGFGPWFVDFFSDEVAVAVEIDGAAHDGREVEDAQRDAWLRGSGIDVLRFENCEVLFDSDTVCAKILSVARHRAPLIRLPLPRGEGGG